MLALDGSVGSRGLTYECHEIAGSAIALTDTEVLPLSTLRGRHAACRGCGQRTSVALRDGTRTGHARDMSSPQVAFGDEGVLLSAQAGQVRDMYGTCTPLVSTWRGGVAAHPESKTQERLHGRARGARRRPRCRTRTRPCMGHTACDTTPLPTPHYTIANTTQRHRCQHHCQRIAIILNYT